MKKSTGLISRARPTLAAQLKLSTALGCVLAFTGTAEAQQAAAPETVVVTGTSIKGAQPVGSNLITVDRASIEDTAAQTVQQLLTNIPGLSGFGGSPQGTQGVPAALGVHGVGQGSSTATLVLIDGHRFAGEGGAESDPDPNIIPTIALDHVDVLPDGASAVYGSDAVSGVINFITRKNFTGVETSIQGSLADSYNSFDAAGVAGYAWTSGSVVAAYEYSSQSRLMNTARSFITPRQDLRRGQANAADFVALPTRPASQMSVTPATSVGTTEPGGIAIPYPSYGSNFQNFTCPVATIAQTSSSNAFYYTAAGSYDPNQNPGAQVGNAQGFAPGWSTSTTNQPSQGLCDTNQYGTELPSVTSNSSMFEVHQDITNDVTVGAQIVYGSHVSFTANSRGSVSGQVFGPTARTGGAGATTATNAAAVAGEINPFYVGNSVTGTATEFVRYDLDPLLGPGAGSKTISDALAASADVTWNLGNDREIVIASVVSTNSQIGHTFGAVSAAEAQLAINGTVSNTGVPGSGGLPDPLALGTLNTPLSRVLTTLNALDVWDPAGSTNKTSAALIAALKTNTTGATAQQALEDVNIKFDGPVFDLPAGAVKVAVGAEFEHMGLDEFGSQTTTAGPTQQNAVSYWNRNGRQIYSIFLEFNVPLISPEMNIPLMQSLNLDASGRYDDYTGGVGDTENPKIGLDWKVTDGLKARMSYGTSFVAANLHDSAPHNSQDSVSSFSGTLNPTNTIPFNTTLGYNGGAGIAGTWVAAPASCAAGGGQVVASDLVTVVGPASSSAFACKVAFSNSLQPNTSLGYNETGGNTNLKPARGRNYSVGLDFDFGKFTPLLEGVSGNVTFYDFEYHNLITNQQTVTFLPQITSFAPPGGWTITSPAIVNFIGGKPVNVITTSPIWATSDGRLQNAYNIWQNGLDYQLNYDLATDDWGNFRAGISGNEMLRYSTQGGNSGAVIDTKDGKNAPRYPSSEMEFSVHLGWNMSGFSTNWTWNFTSPTAYTISGFPYNLSDASGTRGYPVGNPGVFTSSGIAHLGALSTINVTNTYAIPKGFLGISDEYTSGTSISLSIQNLLNQIPPFNASAAEPIGGGSGGATGNPVLRQFTFGIRKNF